MSNISRALLLAKRQSPASSRRRWPAAELARLEAMVGKCHLNDMAGRLGRPIHTVRNKLQYLGYVISRDVVAPLGLNAFQLAERLDIPYVLVNRAVKKGEIRAVKYGKKEFLVTWTDVRRYERLIAARRQRRERLLARIPEPTISKPEFESLMGLSETHAQRYLMVKIVRAWKIPCEFSDIGRFRWEWRVSLADAERVKRLRAGGRLRLGRKAFRALRQCTAEDMRRRRQEGRMGQGDGRYLRACVIPGQFSVSQAAEIAGVSGDVIYRDLRSGRLLAQRVRVGRRWFFAIPPDALKSYLKGNA